MKNIETLRMQRALGKERARQARKEFYDFNKNRTPKAIEKIKIQELDTNIRERTLQLHKQLSVLNHLGRENHHPAIELRSSENPINWESIPPEIAACFKGEFDLHPEEISSFRIHTERAHLEPNEHAVTFQLDRNHRPWSRITLGAINRLFNLRTDISIMSIFTDQQPSSVLTGMEQLDSLSDAAFDDSHGPMAHVRAKLTKLDLVERTYQYASLQFSAVLNAPAPAQI